MELVKIEPLEELRKQLPAPKPKRPPTKAQREAERENEKLKMRHAIPSSMEETAVAKLKEQLEHPDPRIAQAAAKLVLEYRLGKPVQKAEVKQDNVSVVVYESAAIYVEDE